jgi:malic enzyme
MHEVPIFVRSKSVENIVNVVKFAAGSFIGTNLEDISVPHCFEIELRLKNILILQFFTMTNIELQMLSLLQCLTL